MTRDAKVGLLLGLVFIFIIAFIINGLPNFRKSDKDSGNDLTRSRVQLEKNSRGIGNNARQVAQRTVTPIRPQAVPAARPLIRQTAQQNTAPGISQTISPSIFSSTNKNNERFRMSLPPSTSGVNKTRSFVQQKPLTQSRALTAMSTSPKTVQAAAKTRIYKVEDGDSLASIAKKFYGDGIGNKRETVNLLFKANRKVLKNMDAIYIGQKLIIPPIKIDNSDNPALALTGKQFESVDSVGQRKKPASVTKADTKQYIVKEGDNLWKIANEQLGDGNRYPQLAKLNKLEDEDLLSVGMRLKLPE